VRRKAETPPRAPTPKPQPPKIPPMFFDWHDDEQPCGCGGLRQWRVWDSAEEVFARLQVRCAGPCGLLEFTDERR
jgi:hypothetical protein